jgi:hypothetical protein
VSSRIGQSPWRPPALPRRSLIAYTGLKLTPRGNLSKALLLTIVFVPVLLGVWAASSRRAGRGLRRLVLAVLAFDAVYAAFLYYIFLRILVL